MQRARARPRVKDTEQRVASALRATSGRAAGSPTPQGRRSVSSAFIPSLMVGSV